MEFKTYKIKKGGWDKIYETTITIPTDIKLITNPKEVGRVLNPGVQHYLGAIKGDIDEIASNCKRVDYQKLGEYVLIGLENIKFIEDEPEIMTPEDFNADFDFGRYYFIYWDNKSAHLTKIVKINQVRSLYDSEITSIHNYSFTGSLPLNAVITDDKNYILDLFHQINQTMVVSDSDYARFYWEQLLYNKLSPLGIKLYNHKIEVDAANKAFLNDDYELFQKIIKLEKVIDNE